MNRRVWFRSVAVTLVVALSVVVNPVWSAAPQAGLTGRVLAEDARTPLEGAVLQLTGPSDQVIKSEATGPDGTFTLTDLTPGTYRCVVATEEGLYQITTSLRLDPGQTRDIQLALKKDASAAAGVGSAEGGGGAISKNSQAALIGLGLVLFTVGVANALESDNKNKKKSSEVDPGD